MADQCEGMKLIQLSDGLYVTDSFVAYVRVEIEDPQSEDDSPSASFEVQTLDGQRYQISGRFQNQLGEMLPLLSE